MIMKNRAITWILAIFTLYFISSCNQKGSAGFGLVPGTGLNNVVMQEDFKLVTTTVLEDTIRTRNLTRALLGSINDPVFGGMKTGFYSQLRLPVDNLSFGNLAIITVDSVVLSLPYSAFYGDTTSALKFNVYELDEKLIYDSSYYQVSVLKTKPALLGSQTINRFYPSSQKQSVEIKDGANDTVTIAPTLRVHLNDNWIKTIMAKSGQSELSSNSNFLEYFKGVFIETEQVGSGGGIYSFNVTTNVSTISVYYKEGTTRRKFDFLMNNSSVKVNQYIRDDKGSVKFNIKQVDPANQLVYIQGLGSLKTKIELPDIRKIIATNDVAVNKAELYFYVDNTVPNFDVYTPTSRILVIKVDSQQRNDIIPDQFQSYYDGNYNKACGCYKVNITKYVQDLVYSNKDYGLYLTVFNSTIEASRTVIGANNNSLLKPKLIITCTKFD